MTSATSLSASSTAHPARFEVLVLVCSLSLLTYLDRICISRVQLEIQRDLQINTIQMGFIFSAFTAGYALFLVPVGWLADVLGPRRIILTIVLWWSLFTALTGGVFHFAGRGFVVMLLVRFLFGCGEAGVYPVLTTVVRSWFPTSERAFAQGAIFMSARCGAAAAPVITGRLAYLVGWRLAFVVLGILGVLWSILFARVFQDRPTKTADAAEEVPLTPASSASQPALNTESMRFPLRAILLSPAVWALSIAYLGIGCAWSFFPTWQPRYFLDVYQVPFARSELWIGLPFLGGAVGALLGGYVSDNLLRITGNQRWARTSVGVFGCTAAAGCVVTASLANRPWQVVILFFLASFFNDLILGPFWATVTEIAGRFTGTLSGWLNMLASIGSVAFVPLIPWLRSRGYEWREVLILMACIWVIAGGAWLCVNTMRPLIRAASPPTG